MDKNARPNYRHAVYKRCTPNMKTQIGQKGWVGKNPIRIVSVGRLEQLNLYQMKLMANRDYC